MHNPNNQNMRQKAHSTLPAPWATLLAPGSFLRRHGITLVLVAAILYLWFRPPATVTEENRPVGEWSVQLADGRTVTSAQLKGKVVLINFWATWCPYCLKEMPVIQEFWQNHRAQDFEVLAISLDDPPEKIAQYMQNHSYRFMAANASPSVLAAFGKASTIPTSFVLDKNGSIRYKINGQVHEKRLHEVTDKFITH